jgi:hypothetical protein
VNEVDRVLLAVGAVHGVIGLGCLVALLFPAEPVLGVHPALKPMKFGTSIGIFLVTMAWLLPALSMGDALRRALTAVLATTMTLEMFPIAFQAIRGTTSHFNRATTLDSLLWQLMVISIVTATFAMLAIAVAATSRRMTFSLGDELNDLLRFACRASLWLFLLSAVSGFMMGGRLSHSVGGTDGGPGLPILNFSRTHGDLRVSHFFAMHSLQALPATAFILGRLGLPLALEWTALVGVTAAWALVTVYTLIQALYGRPLLET